MTLPILSIWITVAAAILTGLIYFLHRGKKNLGISFLQNWVGSLFLFSGWVKAVDPLGTAYKMEQYFAEFESTFAETWLSFVAPLFPLMNDFNVEFSVTMIILEFILGVALIIGWKPKFTAWLLFLVLAFFTILTGFTYLTGYIPNGVNFFDFAGWAEYEITNRKVTDCGCFGDFLKLDPGVSFLKDVVLLVPGVLFIIFAKKEHQLWSKTTRNIVIGATAAATLLYCMSNYVWNIPSQDFRPFKNGVNIRDTKQAQLDAQAAVQVTAYKLTNKESGEVVELPTADYMKRYKEFPKTEWEFEQIKTEPTLVANKIADFEISDERGEDVSDELLNDPNYNFFIVAYHLKYDTDTEQTTVYDTTYVTDTILVADRPEPQLVRSVAGVQERQINRSTYEFDNSYAERWTEVVNPVMNAAMEAGLKVRAVTKYQPAEALEDFRHETQSAYPIYVADDILLKTIVRSNPGVLLMRDGQIIKKWHYKKLPSFEEIREEYMGTK